VRLRPPGRLKKRSRGDVALGGRVSAERLSLGARPNRRRCRVEREKEEQCDHRQEHHDDPGGDGGEGRANGADLTIYP